MKSTTQRKTYALNKLDEQLLNELAKTSPFWGSIRAKYAQYDSLTEAQYRAFERDKSWRKGALKIDGRPVRNTRLLDGEPLCWLKTCDELATIVVGNVGVCDDHEDEQREHEAEYQREHAPTTTTTTTNKTHSKDHEDHDEHQDD